MAEGRPENGKLPHSAVARLTQSCLLLIAIVLIVRLAWAWHFNRLLSAQVKAIRSRGEPVHLSDFHPSDVPESQDAWPLILQAASAVTVDSPRNSNLEYRNHPPYPPEWIRLAKESERAHVAVFDLMRRAELRAGANVIRSGNGRISWLNAMRALANTLTDGATYANLSGRDADALDRSLETLLVASATRSEGSLVSQLVGTGIDALACDGIFIIGPGLQSDALQSAPRGQLLRLMSRLLDDEPCFQALRGSFLHERAQSIDDRYKLAGDIWFMRPLLDAELVRTVESCALGARVAEERTTPAVVAVVEKSIPGWHPNERWRGGKPQREHAERRYSRWFNPDARDPWFEAYIQMHFRVISERRAAAISLAVQIYRLDHRCWPARLDDLVPAVLPRIPTDPFCDDGRPMGYMITKLPDGTDRPLLYFEAGEDEGLPTAAEPLYDWQISQTHRRTLDAIRQYRDLSRFPPPPSTKSLDHDAKESDAPGK